LMKCGWSVNRVIDDESIEYRSSVDWGYRSTLDQGCS